MARRRSGRSSAAHMSFSSGRALEQLAWTALERHRSHRPHACQCTRGVSESEAANANVDDSESEVLQFAIRLL
eukprot:7912435-Alexandrium_andersonii.AAC.1